MSNREELSPILVAIHNACIALEKTKEELLKQDKKVWGIYRDIEKLKELATYINNLEKLIIEDVLLYFNDENYHNGWDSVKTWYDKKGNLKVLKKHDYDFSMEVLNNICDQLHKKYLEDFEIEDNLILE